MWRGTQRTRSKTVNIGIDNAVTYAGITSVDHKTATATIIAQQRCAGCSPAEHVDDIGNERPQTFMCQKSTNKQNYQESLGASFKAHAP